MQPHIRLNMIVKNETAVILRCLKSVKPWIHSWAIVDTGSTDGTQQLIQDFMQDLPGKLFERPWQNFGFNRTEALQLAQDPSLPHADYLMFIDADQTLMVDPDFEWGTLTGLAYYFEYIYSNIRYQLNSLVSTQIPWKWEGVLHEYLNSPEPHQWQLLKGPHVFVQHDGARGRDPTTYLKDIEILKQAIIDEPDNLRYKFYLAQSYQDANLPEPALEAYQVRANAGGWEEERWTAQFRAAKFTEKLKQPAAEIRTAYLQTWVSRPQRAEPLYELARFYRENHLFESACQFALQACQIKRPSDTLFVDESVYSWRALDEFSVAASYCPSYKEQGKQAILKLLMEQKYPASEETRLIANLRFYK